MLFFLLSFYMIRLFRIRVSSGIQLMLLLVLTLVSFWILSPWKSPFLNSDNAVHILMTYDCQLPEDLYFWGQDRLGSLIPLLGHGLYVLFNMAPPLAASLSLYLILFSTVLLLGALLNRVWSRLLLALLVFFPVHQMDYLLRLGHPYAAQFLFIALGLYSLKQYTSGKGFWKYAFTALASASWMLALWASDMTLVAFVALSGVGAGWVFRNQKEVFKSIPLLLLTAFIVLLVSGAGLAFLAYAKSAARAVTSYDQNWMGSAHDILTGAKKYVKVFVHILQGQQGWFGAAHHGLLVILVLLLIRLVYRFFVRKQGQFPRSALFFLLCFMGGECLLTLSKWVALNNFNGWYQTYPYICLLLCLVFLADRAEPNRWGLYLNTLLASLLLVSLVSVNRIYLLKINRDFNERSLSELKDMRKLGRCGVIGDYWHSYLPAALNPEMIKATPFEDGRSDRCTDSVMACEKIYLIKDAWLEKFPAEYNAYGRTLYFSGDSLKLSDWELGLYLRRKREVNR
jgi:hypothetical protein